MIRFANGICTFFLYFIIFSSIRNFNKKFRNQPFINRIQKPCNKTAVRIFLGGKIRTAKDGMIYSKRKSAIEHKCL